MSESQTNRPYPAVDPQADYPSLEKGVLARWEAEGTFQASIDARPSGEKGANEFVFYDGPPFANGLPHYGHLLTGFVKDIVPRYQTMRGRRVERRFGWDCHGLPAEMAAEKELGVTGRKAIAEYGIERFNEHCRSTVLKYTDEWKRYVTRQARWVDFERDYKTMDTSYMESVLWAFKQLHEKGLLYESHRVMAYSWAAESPVSNFETRMDNSYRERQDPALTVRFRLEARAGDAAPMDLVAWTTTPWTLPSNLALAVGPEIDYQIYELDGVHLVLGAAAAAKYEKELVGAQALGSLKGSELVGRQYEPLFPYFAGHPKSFQVLGAAFVDTEEGTGVVHMAPGFGEDDQRICEEHGIELVCPVDDRGAFTSEVTDWVGQNVLEANKPIIKHLKDAGAVLRHETYLHNYPHCWRTDEPLIYKALSSWFVKVTDFRDRMVELNKGINWIPGHVRDGQFGKWLEGARDWSISRNRFWGAPIPVWKSDDPKFPRTDVYGSLDELERDFGVRPKDLHRPTIDELTRPNPDDPSGKSTMRRVEDVFDCWFESGSMPYAQLHYPFEHKEWFEDHFPADFIVEYIAQTRGWFYTMMVLSTALFDRPPFQNCICHGVVLDADGQKLSKRLRNYPDPEEVFDTKGADALRWFLVSSAILNGNDLSIDRDARAIGEVVRLVLNPIWNAWYFFSLYANADGLRGNFRTDQTGVLDRYILAKTRQLVDDYGGAMDRYELATACAEVRSFLDALNNWYIRRSRPRFWKTEVDQDKRDAYDTLYTVLHVLCRAVSPLLPLLTDEIFHGLANSGSVHLADWPDAEQLPQDAELVQAMDRVRDVCSTALGLREEHRLRVRLPLASLTIAGAGAASLKDFADLLRDEVNVKDVKLESDIGALGEFNLKVNARSAGPRLGGNMKSVMAAARAGEWQRTDEGGVELAGQTLLPGEFDLQLVPRGASEDAALSALSSGDALIALDVVTTPALEQEGLARDLVRQIQSARKEADLHVSDRIEVWVDGPNSLTEALEAFGAYICEQVLADQVVAESAPGDAIASVADMGAIGEARLGLRKL